VEVNKRKESWIQNSKEKREKRSIETKNTEKIKKYDERKADT
jgi:hypothetical protein